MDVTEEILRNVQTYGSSDYTAPHTYASAKCLNYADGPSIQRPINERVSIYPRTLKYQDSVGLFGAENVFIKINLDIQDSGNACLEEAGWDCLKMTRVDQELVNTYYTAKVDPDIDLVPVNTYDPAQISNEIPSFALPYIGINLKNLKTGNKYIDSWFDVRLYTKSRDEHPYDQMYLPLNSYFYIGFHARNTRKLPYNVECIVGTDIKPKDLVDPRLIAKV